MQHAVFAKGSEEFIIKFGFDILCSSFKNYMKRKKGYKALNKTVQYSTNTFDDKAHCAMYFNLYKCPRFAK